MRLSILSCSLLAYLSSLVSATALTYKLSANEKACFYSYVENKGAKVAFYFAVSSPLLPSLSLRRIGIEIGIGIGTGAATRDWRWQIELQKKLGEGAQR
jgi:hypothetical protein